MTHTHKDTKEEHHGINPVAAAVTGAVVGAGVAVAGTIAMQDKNKREQVMNAFTHIKDQAVGYMDDIQKVGKEKQEEVKHAVHSGKKKVEKLVDTAEK